MDWDVTLYGLTSLPGESFVASAMKLENGWLGLVRKNAPYFGAPPFEWYPVHRVFEVRPHS